MTERDATRQDATERLLHAERLLTVGLEDRADAIFRAVAETDPGNVDALLGMARCALAGHDDHEAYRLAARAHRVDPDHDMARRMEARLAEILRTRGEEPGADGSASAAPQAIPGPRRSLLARLRGR